MAQGITFYVNPDTGLGGLTPPANLSPSSRGIVMTQQQRSALMEQITSMRGALGTANFFANPDSLSDDQLWDAYVSAVQATGNGPSDLSTVLPLLSGMLVGGAAGGALGGATGEATGAAATDASTGLFAGESATAGSSTYYGTVGGGATGYASGASPTLLADAGTTMTDVGPGYGAATQMPAATPEVDPTFSGDLTQTGTGQFENLSGDLTAPSASGNWWDQYIDPKYAPMLKTLADLTGKVAPAALGAYGANQQSNNFKELADKYLAVGAPSRARFEGSFAPGFSMEKDPGYTDALNQTTKATLHGLSVNGNPAGSPNAWERTLKDVNAKFAFPALNEFRRVNAGAGGLAALTSAAPGADAASVNAGKGVYDAIGGGMADIFNPPRSLSDLLREFKRAGY